MRKLLVLTAVMLFMASAAFGQEGGSISGTVQGELNGTLLPLRWAHVAAFQSNADHPIANAATDSLGHYQMQVPYGEYLVKAEKMGFVAEWFDNVLHRSEATPVPVTSENSPDNINFVLGPVQPPPQDDGSIDGRIIEAGTDHGIPMAFVRAIRVVGEPLTLETRSMWNGFYVFPHVPPGSYIVHAEKEGFDPGAYPDTLLITDNAFHGINIILQPGEPPPPPRFGSIAGMVTDDSTDLPVEGAEVLAFGNHHNWPRRALSGADGSYILDSLPSDTYHLFAHKFGYLPAEYPDPVVIDSVQVTGINFALIPYEETGISGTITDAATSQPIAGASIFAHNVDNHHMHFMGRSLENGTYFVHTLPGEFVVEAVAMGYWRMAYPEHVTVVQNDVTANINFGLNAINFGSIAGLVTDSAGTPVPMAMVEARRIGGNFMSHGRTDSVGAYLLDNIMPGSYRVVAFHRDFGPGAYPDSVVVADGQDITGINIVLGSMFPPHDGVISGTVTDDSTGAPVVNAMVLALGRSGEYGRMRWYFRRAFTDSSGQYSLANLPVVPMKLFAASRGYLGEFYDNVRHFYEATPVTPDAENINFALTYVGIRTRSIAGRILMPEGLETDGIFVNASVDGQIYDIIAADPMGFYNLDNLEADTYELEVVSVYGENSLDHPVDVVYSDAREDIEFHVTSADDNQRLPVATSLAQNYPNPFNARTMISFNLAQPGHVELSVYNIVGQRVSTLVSGEYDSGNYIITWDGRDSSGRVVSSGVYYYRLTANGLTKTLKMTMLK
ncbi:MAG: hypothetical protein A2W25_07715 [candidate division Zixibacteria bacterium RBG_16_53_22]|nr:MAG: hypothetical protein A2W25_07715 [candidate division Zixibacteria bacterium RBG_16_53_22]